MGGAEVVGNTQVLNKIFHHLTPCFLNMTFELLNHINEVWFC